MLNKGGICVILAQLTSCCHCPVTLNSKTVRPAQDSQISPQLRSPRNASDSVTERIP
jgi:hypothetical protein